MKLVNRAKMTTATTGTGTITLGSAVTGFQTFADAGLADGETVRYAIEDGDAWEIGQGVYTASGTTLTRELTESSTGALLNLSGSAVVFGTVAAEDIPVPASPFVNPTLTTGQTAYTGAGTYSWVCPADVYYVNVVAVGAGGGGIAGSSAGGGGGGGGLGWINNYAVTPGNSYTVVVGLGGDGGSTAVDGGDSYFVSTATVCGFGGKRAVGNVGGSGGTCFPSTQGGNGGNGGDCTVAGYSGGGGGAAGYSGNGGAGGIGTITSSAAATGFDGSGGGAGGGGGGDSAFTGGGGGGVGILGEGSSGTGGAGSTTSYGSGGGGGSGGSDGGIAAAGSYGGGGAGSDNPTSFGDPDGASGAVRIIWGPNRAFPSTNTGDL